MDKREQLIELILKSEIFASEVGFFNCHFSKLKAECVADFLFENGVILPPCKPRDTVWCTSETKVVQATVDSITYNRRQECCVELNFRCESDCEGCPFADWSQSYSGEWVCSGEYGWTMVGGDSFGKTIFITEKEAEEALKKLETEKTLQ